jgi:hypothetical protein
MLPSERIFEPFDIVYRAVTQQMDERAESMGNDSLRAKWLRTLIAAFQAERVHWDGDGFKEYRTTSSNLRPRYLRLVAGAFLHISYDLPRAMANNWPEEDGELSETDAAAIYLDLSPIFPTVLESVSTNRHVMGRLLSIVGSFRYGREIMKTASLWMMYLRTVAWVHAGLLRQSPNPARAETAMLKAMTNALEGVTAWKPWSFGILIPPQYRDGGLHALILFGVNIGDTVVGLLAGFALLSIPLLSIIRQTSELRLFVDEFGRRVEEEVGVALRGGKPDPSSSPSPAPPSPQSPGGRQRSRVRAR